MSEQSGQFGSSGGQTTPPGWYPDSTGVTRWWDGTQWGQAADASGGFAPQPAQAYGSGPTKLDPGAALSYGWKKFQEHAGVLVALVLVVFLVTLVGTFVAFLAIIPAISGDGAGAVLGWLAYCIAILVVIGLSFVVQAGMYRASLAVTKGVAPSMSMLVQRDNLGTYIGTVLLVSLAATVGMFLCFLPGLAVLFFTAYAPLVALDKGVGPVEAITTSYNLVKEHIGEVFLVLLLAYAVYYIGSLACYVGLLVSAPVALIAITYSYRVLMGEQVAP